MKFRKKPVVIDAVLFDGLNHDAVADFCAPHTIKVGGNFTLLIPTLEGEHTAQKGDWIIKGVKEEVYPCKPDVFAATYEPAETFTVNNPCPKSLPEMMGGGIIP